MKILQINAIYGTGSTGRIVKELGDVASKTDIQCFYLCAYSHLKADNVYITEILPFDTAVRKNILLTRLSGLTGYMDWLKTKKAIRWINSIKPDIIHLHNIHGDWINIEMLMKYIKEKNIPVVWTLHDCWSFTGRCSHFENKGCYKWKTGCNSCSDLKVYPTSYFFDFSKKMWMDKKKWFLGIKNMTIVTPSLWLAKYVSQSFLGSYRIETINNGIDVNLFSPTSIRSNYLNSSDNRKIILGVASMWTRMKGLDDIITLYNEMDSKKYLFVLVGLNTRQMSSLPSGIVGIQRTNNINELATLYSNASVFINPTYQDNYPTVNLESIACGTPVITYKTGGSVESVTRETGLVVEKGNIKGLKDAIVKICNSNQFNVEKCREYAIANFHKEDRYSQYIKLYQEINNN